MPHVEKTMKTLMLLAAAAAVATTLSVAAPPANAAVAWCADSGFDNGPARERGPGTGPYWSGEPSDCNSIWRRGYYRGTDPDPNIRQQLMRDR
jgi:Spy/CpxP family protein refolding chaperone